MSIGCVAIAGRPQDVVSSSGALWGHQTAETARGREWCIRYRITRLRNSVLSIANAPTGESSVLLCSPVRSVSTSGTVEIEARRRILHWMALVQDVTREKRRRHRS